MKYTKRLSVMASLALAFLSFALFAHSVSAQQDNQQANQSAKQPKFRPAPPGAKQVRADEWMISLDMKLTEEEFERELERILIQYDAKVIPTELTSDRPGKDAKSHYAFLQVPEARARQIAEDNVVTEVYQNRELESYSFGPPPAKNTAKPGPEGVWPLPGAPVKSKSKSKSKQRPDQDELGSSVPDGSRFTSSYNLDRIDTGGPPVIYNNLYNFTNGGAGVDIYTFDTGINTQTTL